MNKLQIAVSVRSRVPIIIQSQLSRLILTLTDMFGLRLTAATAVCIRNVSEISGKKMLTLLHVSDELNHIIQLEMERRRRRGECTSHDNEYNELIVYNSSFSSWNEIIPLSLIIISIHFPSSSLFSLSLVHSVFSSSSSSSPSSCQSLSTQKHTTDWIQRQLSLPAIAKQQHNEN